MKFFLKIFFILLFNESFSLPSDFTLSFNTTDASCNGASDGKAEVIVLSGSNPPYSYSWSTGATTPQITGLLAGVYSVTVTDYLLNDTSVSVEIKERSCEISAELAFTPNDDGTNDEWDIANIQFYPDFLLLVYNRWGQKVYEQNGNYEAWDGNNFGLKVPDATYYFVIYNNKTDKEILKKGSVTIVR